MSGGEMFTYFSWWYSEEPVYLARAAQVITKKVYLNFSVPILLRTLFDPWKRDVSYVENPSLDMAVKIWAMNLFSRAIGFIVRTITILIGLILSGIVFVLLIIGIIIWYLMPIIIFLLLVNGLRLLGNG